MDVFIDSDQAHFYAINRLDFWRTINADLKLQKYIRYYYCQQLDTYFWRLERQITNNRKGQICAFMYDTAQRFGINENAKRPTDIFINHRIKQTTIAQFLGMPKCSAVTRIMSELGHEQVIEINKGYITVKDLTYLEHFANQLQV